MRMSRGSCGVETALSRKCPKFDTAYREIGCFGLRETAAAGCKASEVFCEAAKVPRLCVD